MAGEAAWRNSIPAAAAAAHGGAISGSNGNQCLAAVSDGGGGYASCEKKRETSSKISVMATGWLISQQWRQPMWLYYVISQSKAAS